MTRVAIIAAFLALTTGAMAQELEINSLRSALTSGGVDPTPGTPFGFDPKLETILELEVSGQGFQPYILVVGSLASNSTAVGSEFFDLDLNAPLQILVDGFQGTGPLYGTGTFGVLPGLGEAAYVFPISNANIGDVATAQAIVADPFLPPFHLNFSAAGVFEITPPPTFTSGTVAIGLCLPNVPMFLHGQAWDTFTMVDDGTVRFGNSPFGSAGSFSSMLNTGSTTGNTPYLCVFKGNLSGFVYTMSAEVLMPGLLECKWMGFSLGTPGPSSVVICQIDAIAQTITMDYTMLGSQSALMPITVGIFGSSVNPPMSSLFMPIDFVDPSGVGTSFTPPTTDTYSIYQHFSGGSHDLSGRVITFTDFDTIGASGQYAVSVTP